MKAEFYQQELTDLIRMVEAGRGDESEAITELSAANYTCPQKLAAERELFKEMPLIVGHSSEAKTPGDYFVTDDLGPSYLVVRGADGKLRAFLNYCQHRGTQRGDC